MMLTIPSTRYSLPTVRAWVGRNREGAFKSPLCSSVSSRLTQRIFIDYELSQVWILFQLLVPSSSFDMRGSRNPLVPPRFPEGCSVRW